MTNTDSQTKETTNTSNVLPTGSINSIQGSDEDASNKRKKNDERSLKCRKFIRTGFVRDCDSKRIDGIQVYKAKLSVATGVSGNSKTSKYMSKDWKGWIWSCVSSLRLYNAVFIILYMYQGFAVIRSSGEPYREFLQKADIEGFQVMQGSVRIRAELEHSFRDLNNPKRRTGKVGWTDWIDMEIEELVEEKKRDKERTVLDSLPKHLRVPGRYQTAFWPTLLFGCLVSFHALILLLQYWSVPFNIFMNYEEVDVDSAVELMNRALPIRMDLKNISLDDDNNANRDEHSTSTSSHSKSPAVNKIGKFRIDSSGNRVIFPDREITAIPATLPSHARVVPSKLGEKDILVPIQYLPTLGMCIEYHRRRYVYNPTEQSWCKIRCRTDFHLSFLRTWKGFANQEQTIAGQIRFGPNLFRVKQPTFIELYQAQLLNPFAVFQIFCVLLWAIDDYLIFSFFSLFMVFLFEGTVVFQRLKSLQALRSMGNPSRNIFVYRDSHWTTIDSAELLPGDIASLTLIKPHRAKALEVKDNADDSQKNGQKDAEKKKKMPAEKSRNAIQHEGGDIVPADLLLLCGSTVVNEASLTGESVPQMKEGLSELENATLSMKHQHKMNVVYAGTKMLQCQGSQSSVFGSDAEPASTTNGFPAHAQSCVFDHIPTPPDNGCTCFVLRTGFASAQGKLVRMIEGSQEKVKGHEYETGLLLGMLCIFAIISSSYVLYNGMKNANRSKYELLLHCIMIVTNVIRPELPMQMAMAVNTSILTLLKLHVYCTEPYRVPVAGKLTACLFDKTGTLTTDELVAIGVCEPNKLQHLISSLTDRNEDSRKSNHDVTLHGDENVFTAMAKLTKCEAALVLAGCQSLVVYDDETMGDPLESAALKSMKWHISISTGCAEPIPAVSDKRPGGHPIVLDNGRTSISEVSVLTRHHFSSKLQSMSCVVKAGMKRYAVAKGSPEAVGNMLTSKPIGYENASEFLSKQGYRVIGLAYKTLETDADVDKAKETRAFCEANLTFCGFIAFTCMVRKDTADVLQRLREGGMSIAMITGDALFTAIHVAREVDIISESNSAKEDDVKIDPELVKNAELRKLVEEKRGKPIEVNQEKAKKPKKEFSDAKAVAYLDTINNDGLLFWCNYANGCKIVDYNATDVERLSKEYDLATTGKCLSLALEYDSYTSKVLGYIKIFARMTPDAKETVIEALHSIGEVCLMCGDGANDVGALKQADVGVALLSGFGNVNVDRLDDHKVNSNETKNEPPVTAIMSQDHLNQIRALPVSLIKMKIKQLGIDPSKYPEIVEKEDLVKLYQIKAREVAVRRHDERNALAKKQMTKKEEEAERKRLMQEKQIKMQERIAELEAQGVSWAALKVFREFAAAEMEEARQKKLQLQQSRGVEGSAASLAAQLEAAMGGDGNDLDEMGQPMVKLGDASIAAPFTSKMPSIRSCVDIVRQGRCTLVTSMQMYQIMALQCLISSYSLSALYLDGVKYADTQMTALGMLGTVLHLSISRSKPLDKLSRVQPISSIFHPASIFSLLGQFVVHLVTMILAVHAAKKHLPQNWDIDLEGQFKPGILNTSVFLISSVQQVTVFVVNLQGPPFMTGVIQNRPLLWTLIGTFILTFMFASESVPGLNRYFQLVPFPDSGYRDYILMILSVDLIATFAFDRAMKFLFAREILKAGFEGMTRKDIVSLLQTFAIIAFLMVQFLGNSETWDTIIAMQDELALNASRALVNNEDDGGIYTNTVANCLNGVCDVVADTTKTSIATPQGSLGIRGDEF